jgi:hypothetical protein
MQTSAVTAVRFVAALAVAIAVPLARAEEAPKFRQGMWEFDRTAPGGQRMHKAQCTNPSDDMKRQNEMIEKSGGCKISPMQHSGNTYTFSADCNIASPQGGLVSFRSTSVMTVESDSAYKIEVTTSGAQPGPVGKEQLTARRTGDCSAKK